MTLSQAGESALLSRVSDSPRAEFRYAPEPIDTPPTAVSADSCFRSIEFVGILRGTDKPIASALLVDFLTSTYFQELLPETNFVLPANTKANIPQVFQDFLPTNKFFNPARSDAGRDQWTEQ